MAIKKSKITGGMARRQMPSPYVAHQPVTTIITHEFSEAVASTDILELAALPPYCKIVSIEMIGSGTGATTFTVGFMSGEFGSSDPARTLGNELFNAVAAGDKAEAAIPALAALAVTDSIRSIGVRPSANVAANPATKLHFRISYVTGFA
ncbi:hypothetical protein LOS78_01830 [Paracoccus sp. MA]|uniref:hypothetical protein n=1 Tax=Paracoccus sp. MA TaxID=2895796 RepID=UPI001E601C51|nr:hypothetical protein [Paracoccus sp. MA]UFM64239.1 hypothetical protein LOS78_01830 [Paracoccus sp. MA]